MKHHRKLVRDDVPTKILDNNELSEFRCLEGEAKLIELKRKLLEEAIEVLNAPDTESLVDELADILEVVQHIIYTHPELKGYEVVERQREKCRTHGGFHRGCFLLTTETQAERLDRLAKVAG